MTVRAWIAALASVLAAAAAIAAAIDPHSGRPIPPTVFAVDRSASVDSAMRQTESDWISAATQPSRCVQACSVVSFGAVASSLPPSRALAGKQQPATDLGAGLGAAVAATPDGGRVVVLGDGRETTGATTAPVAAARARHVTIDTVALADTALLDAAITRLDAPRTVHRGDTVSLLATVRATVGGPAKLSVSRDGKKPESQSVQLRSGDNAYTLSYTAASAGWHTFKVSVGIDEDGDAKNNAQTVSVDVVSAPKVLVASADPSPPIASLLQSRGARVSVAQPGSLPAVAGAYASQDAVVLDDVPASSLGSGQISALSGAVRDDGLGLLALGGKHAYSLGGYARSPLNALLPVGSLVPGDLQRKNLAIELVIDRSGSMNDTAGGVAKISMVRTAARDVVQFVGKHRDELGIAAFDIEPHDVLPMQRIVPGKTDKSAIATVDRITANGGTDIYLGLQLGFKQLMKSKAKNRHIILLTDGISQPHNYKTLLQQLVSNHISVATVALGTHLDAALLRSIASTTKGTSYATTNAHDLPRIFVKETRLSAKPVQVSGRQQVLPQGASPIVRSLAGRTLPALSGNVVTNLRPGAEADLMAHSTKNGADPVLAQWGYGTGRVVAWTPGLGAPWATAWTTETGLWNDAVRWVARAPQGPRATVTATEQDGTTVTADLTALAPAASTALKASIAGPGTPRTFTLRESSPGIYTATLPPMAPQAYSLNLELPATLGGAQALLLDVPYDAEFSPTPPGSPCSARSPRRPVATRSTPATHTRWSRAVAPTAFRC